VSGRSDLEQAIVDHLKIARTAIVLKHRIAADDELNKVLPALRVRLEAQAQKGYLPAPSAVDLLTIANEFEHYAS